MSKYVGRARLEQLLSYLQSYLGGFVKKEAGKGLSTNDLTDELKDRYDRTALIVEGLIDASEVEF